MDKETEKKYKETGEKLEAYNEGIPSRYQLTVYPIFKASEMIDNSEYLEALSYIYQLGFKAGERYTKNKAKKKNKKEPKE